MTGMMDADGMMMEDTDGYARPEGAGSGLT